MFYGFILLYLLWLFYLAVMNLKRVKDAGKLTTVGLIFGYPILIIGYVLDVLSNILVMTVLLLELPRELLVTQRLKRHKDSPTWRGTIARWFGDNLLDQFDPSGKHL